jgi:3-dehydroquinate dehydratase / shikimate dehydrogenase
MARQKGIPIVTGIEMFVQQGARQFEIFTGKPAPEEEMLRVVIHSLRQQAEAAPEASAAEAKAPASKAKKTPVTKAKKAS